MRRVLIHIGTEKTGTTTIQEFLHINREKLYSKGIVFLKSPGERNQVRDLVTYCMNPHRVDKHAHKLELTS